MKLAVNFSEVQARSIIPAGEYDGVIADVTIRQKEGSEHPYLNWEVAIADGEYEGRKPQALVTTFNPKGQFGMMEAFQNLGYQDMEFEIEVDDTTGQLLQPEVIGLPCKILVFNDTWNGRPTSKISNIFGPNGEDVSGARAVSAAVAAAPAAARPATRTSPGAKPAGATTAPTTPAAKNGPAKRSPFPAGGARKFT